MTHPNQESSKTRRKITLVDNQCSKTRRKMTSQNQMLSKKQMLFVT